MYEKVKEKKTSLNYEKKNGAKVNQLLVCISESGTHIENDCNQNGFKNISIVLENNVHILSEQNTLMNETINKHRSPKQKHYNFFTQWEIMNQVLLLPHVLSYLETN